MNSMFDFTTTKVRCSTIYRIMAGADRKTPFQKYLDCAAEVAEKKMRLNNMIKKNGPGYAKLELSIEQLEPILKVLGMAKDQPLELSDGAKTFSTELYADVKYGKWNPSKDIGSKFTTKGKLAEDDAIALVSRLEGQLLYKNELMVENEFLKGTPDVIVGEDPYNAEKILDVKCPWDSETFFANLNDDLIQQYKFQMQGYMAITGAPVAEVHFCLVNLPAYMWEKERINLFNRMEVATDDNVDYKLAEAQLFRNLNFDDMPEEERRLKFTVERDDELIEKIYDQVKKIREYLPTVEKMHLFGRDSVFLPEITEIVEAKDDNS